MRQLDFFDSVVRTKRPYLFPIEGRNKEIDLTQGSANMGLKRLVT
jgi:hypothetical protein